MPLSPDIADAPDDAVAALSSFFGFDSASQATVVACQPCPLA